MTWKRAHRWRTKRPGDITSRLDRELQGERTEPRRWTVGASDLGGRSDPRDRLPMPLLLPLRCTRGAHWRANRGSAQIISV